MRDWSTSEIRSIKIRSTWTGLADPPFEQAETDIERWGESFLASDQALDSGGNDVERRVVATGLIDRLLMALREPRVTEPDPVNMDITPEWFQENFKRLIIDAAEGYSDAGKRRYAERVGNYEFYCGQILNEFRSESTDDYPEIVVRVGGNCSQIEELQTSSQHFFMLPWHIGRRQTYTFNCHISRAVAALMPDVFLNKGRLLHRPVEFGPVHDHYDDLLDEPERSVPGHSRRICSLFFTPDGKSLISAGMDNVVKIWDASEWVERHCFDMLRVGVNLAIDLAPNGTIIAFNDASVIKIVDIRTGHIIQQLKGHTWVVRRLLFSLDGTQLSSEDSDGVRFWDVKSGEQLGNEPGKRLSRPSSIEEYKRITSAIASSERSIQVSVSSRKLGGQAVKIFDRTTRNNLRGFVTKGIGMFALRPDGRCLVTEQSEGRLAVWQLPAR